MKKIYIKKMDGERELFDEEKLKLSLRRAGASGETINLITEKVLEDLYDGISTSEIYKKAFKLLKKNNEKIVASKYSVRRAVIELGPDGFPFEDFVGEVFRTKNYKVEVGKTIGGACVVHEMDVMAYNKDELALAELKFHNNTGGKSDLKTILYVKARFDDIEKGSFYKKFIEKRKFRRMLITNTKFTSRALRYGNCVGVEMIGWDYPAEENLNDLIEQTSLQPLTILHSLTKKEKNLFLRQGIVLCRDLIQNDGNLLNSFGISDKRAFDVINEVNNLLKNNKS